MKICILEAGLPPEALTSQFGTYADMFSDWMGIALPDADFSSIKVVCDEPLPGSDQFDGYLITGSRCGVYENLPWMKRLQEFLLMLRAQSIPVGGVCFGHQIMAEAFGGKVEKAPRGWVLGLERYPEISNMQTGRNQPAHAALAIHQDQVVRLPDQVEFHRGNERCPIGVISYSFPALSVQYHPEFSQQFFTALLEHHAGEVFSSTSIKTAFDSITREPDSELIAREFAALFYGRTARGAGS